MISGHKFACRPICLAACHLLRFKRFPSRLVCHRLRLLGSNPINWKTTCSLKHNHLLFFRYLRGFMAAIVTHIARWRAMDSCHLYLLAHTTALMDTRRVRDIHPNLPNPLWTLSSEWWVMSGAAQITSSLIPSISLHQRAPPRCQCWTRSLSHHSRSWKQWQAQVNIHRPSTHQYNIQIQKVHNLFGLTLFPGSPSSFSTSSIFYMLFWW